jgi:antitoxin MazE
VLEVVYCGILISTVGVAKLTLAQKLKAFDPNLHAGEVMASARIGAEVF